MPKIALKLIDVPPDNRDDIDPKELDGLAATMLEFGQLQPIAVRPGKKGRYELIFGERRLRAAQALNWKEIDAAEFTADDRKAGELNAIENLQRQDLTPWEEARKLTKLAGHNGTRVRVEDLAQRLGRSPQWVAVRLAVDKLIPPLRQLVIEQDWPLGHLPLLARIPTAAQPAILEAIRETQDMDWSEWDGDKHVPTAPSKHQLAEFLDQYTRLLSAAPWKLDDAFLVDEAGSCDQCAKRSSAQSLLFPELADKKKDQCLDEGCWNRKQAALVASKVDELADEKPVLLQEYGRVPEAVSALVGEDRIESSHKYSKCKKTDPAARPAVFVNGEKAGQVEYVKPARDGATGNAGRPSSNQPIDQTTGEPEPPSTKDRLKTIEQKRKCRAVTLWSEKLETFKPKFTGLLDALVLFFGTDEKRPHQDASDWKDFAKHKAKLGEDAWAQLFPVFQERLSFRVQADGDDAWEEALAQARALGLILPLQFCWHDATVEISLTKALQAEGVKDPGAAFKEAIK